MADATVSSSITLLQTILTFSGALLAPIIGTAASLISRSPLQRRQQAIEYRVKQLELFDKAVSVGKSLSDALGKPFDGSIIEAEYYKLMRQLPEQPPSAEEFPADVQRNFLMRFFWLPHPQTISGWIASTLFYIYGVMFVISLTSIGLYFTVLPDVLNYLGEGDEPLQLYINPAVSLAIALPARYWAIRNTRQAMRRETARFDREAAAAASLN
ncbi:MAG TPA: hypothetical protein VGN21_07690 [Stellaceae bacterium]|jgi:hypothetical protein